MTKIDLIMFNMSSFGDWSMGVQNRNYHILHNLAKNEAVNRILAVDFLPFTFKKALKIYWQDIILNRHHGELVYGDLTTECHRVSSKIYNYSSIDSVFNEKTVLKELKKIISILDLRNIVLWSYNPMFSFYLQTLPAKITVFDTVDNWMIHSSYVKFTNRLQKNYQRLAKEADIIFTVAEDLREFYVKFGRQDNIYFIPNGIDPDIFSTEKLNDPQPVPFFEKNNLKNKKIIGYIGVMQEDRIDFDLLRQIALIHKDKNFVLGGPVWKETEPKIKKNFADLKNVYFPGFVPRQNWVDVCSYFDVALNPHKVNDFNKYTSPTKIYEYLACGKPVVTTAVSGLEEFKDSVYVARNTEEFGHLIDRALNEDRPQKKEQRIHTANQRYRWQERTQAMLDILFSQDKLKGL